MSNNSQHHYHHVKDASGNTTNYQSDASGNQSSYTVDSSGDIVCFVDYTGQTTYYNTDSSHNVSSYTVDVSGNVSHITDISGNITYYHTDSSGNYFTVDPSTNVVSYLEVDVSGAVIYPPIVVYTLNRVVDSSGTEITTRQGQTADGTNVTQVTFITTDQSSNIQITENLIETVQVYDDDSDPSSASGILVNQIKLYASEINCSDFQGKGTVDDYTELFVAASKIANESKQMQLDVDIEGFNEFAQAADDLSALFTSFIVRLENVNIINDIEFLTSISIALGKIVNLSKVFAQFKETILATSTFQLPKSAHDTAVVLKNVMDEITCAMGYISYFVDPSNSAVIPVNAELSSEEQNIIDKAVSTIDNWSVICEEGVSVAMNSNPDIQYITNASLQLKTTTSTLHSMTQSLKSKLSAYTFLH